jgi:tetratricopeptide (TPR) repeat protein
MGTAAIPASAAVFAQAPSEPAAVEDATPKLLDDYQQAMFDRRFEAALQVLDQIEIDPGNKRGRAAMDAMRASALLGLKRSAEAEKLIAEADQLAPDLPEISTMLFLNGLIIDRVDVAADALDRLIARFPDVARELDWNQVRYFFSHEPKGQDRRNEDRRIAMAKLGYGGDTETGHSMANNAIQLLVKRGSFAEAAELLRYVREPDMLEDMLIEKRFASLWPQIETYAGPHLKAVSAASINGAQKIYDANPDDPDALQNLVNAFRHAGRYDEAAALRSKLPATSAEMADINERTGWAINNVALALHAKGSADEADQLFAMLNDAPMKEGRWRVSMIINRLELLVSDGKFDKALPLLDATERSATNDGSDYARQLVRRLKFCTLSRSGRAADAEKIRPDMLAHAQDAPGPTIDGLLCAGDIETAQKVALEALQKEQFQSDFVRQLQARPLTNHDPSIWQGKWQELRQRPAIAEAFNRLGRDMPEQFLPEAVH